MLAARRQALCAAQEGLGMLCQALQAEPFSAKPARPTGRPRAAAARSPPPPPSAAGEDAHLAPQQAQQDQLVAQQDEWEEVVDRNTNLPYYWNRATNETTAVGGEFRAA